LGKFVKFPDSQESDYKKALESLLKDLLISREKEVVTIIDMFIKKVPGWFTIPARDFYYIKPISLC